MPDGANSRAALVLQHAPWEGPGLIGEALRAAGFVIDQRRVVDDESPVLPSVSTLDALVVMGGPMNADDVVGHPGLAAERALLAEAVAAGVPVLAVCLGAQLLARALGAEVTAGAVEEFGFAPVHVHSDDAFAQALAGLDFLHWHCDVAGLPQGAELLASTAATPNQAFRFGERAYGFQFHPEMTEAMLDEWLAQPVMAAELEENSVSLDDVRDHGARALPAVRAALHDPLMSFFAQR